MTEPNFFRRRVTSRWINWCSITVTLLVIGAVVIPWIRVNPKELHTFVLKLSDWQRFALIGLLMTSLAYVAIAQLRPRISHVRTFSFFRHPPVWTAWLVAFLLLMILDLSLGFFVSAYVATWVEWLGAIGCFVLAYALYLLPQWQSASKKRLQHCSPLKLGIDNIDAKTLRAWLVSEAPSNLDALDHYTVAKRIKSRLTGGCRSVGIVGPFGAGKSSIVAWVEGLLETESDILFSKHSCWGFENSASSIHAILTDALQQIEERADTFQFRSLPESYLQVFAAGGSWLDGLAKLFLRPKDPIAEFRRLSDLLGDLKLRLVFVIEDLDRNKSRSFDIQEVLAFLQQLREFHNLNFVLTGGGDSAARIDFSKLCDHIESVQSFSISQASKLLCVFREICLNQETYPHYSLVESSSNLLVLRNFSLAGEEENSVPKAIADLLSTPRSMRHVLASTLHAWGKLYGEVDFDHLLVVNILRFAAPEAYTFVLMNWKRLTQGANRLEQQSEHLARIRSNLRKDWNECCQDVQWDMRSAQLLVELIMPEAGPLLHEGQQSSRRIQGVHEERYWQRAISLDITGSEIRDQEIIRELKAWGASPTVDHSLINKLCTNRTYARISQNMLVQMLGGCRAEILLLCEQVLEKIGRLHGAAASGDSTGFTDIWYLAQHCLSNEEENATWLEQQLIRVSEWSFELLNDLWCRLGVGSSAILRQQDWERVRRNVQSSIRLQLVHPERLERVLDKKLPRAIYRLVFDPGTHDSVLSDPVEWQWLGPVLLQAIEMGQVSTALATRELFIRHRQGAVDEATVVFNLELLRLFFGENLQQLADATEALLPRFDEAERIRMERFVNALHSTVNGQ